MQTNKTVSTQKTRTLSRTAIYRLTVSAVLAALTTLMTAYILHIPVGTNGGYVHLGDTIIYLSAAMLPMPYAFAVGAIGGGLADLLTAPIWAPATILIKMLICLPFSAKGSKFLTIRNCIAPVISFIISGLGYYIAEGILFGFDVSFWTSVSGSVVQSGGSMLAFLLIAAALDKMQFKKRFASLL